MPAEKGVGMRVPSALPNFLLVMTCLLVLCLPQVQASASQNDEYQVKAAFIYNFTNYIQWPGRAFSGGSSPFTICIMGRSPFGNSFDSLARETIGGRRAQVRHISRIEDAKECHILFISESEQKNAPQILRSLQGRPVLTIGDYKGFCQDGGMINLVMVKRKVRFEIRPGVAKRAGVHIGPQLLALAREIIE